MSCALGLTAWTEPANPDRRRLRSTARPIESSDRPAPTTATEPGRSTGTRLAAVATRCRASLAAS